jgi:hypothetical protein
LRQRKLYQMVKSLVFRRRMTETLHEIEDEIKNSLLKEEKEEMITGEFKISIKEEGQIEVTELPPLNLEQLDLPLRHPEEFGKGNS